MTQEKKKLLVIINRLVIGGQALDTIPLLHRLQDSFTILVLYGCREKDEVEATILLEKFNDISVKPLVYFKRSFNPVQDIPAFFSILKTIRAFKPQVVHTHGMKSGLFGRVAAWLCGVQCIVHTFHGHHFHSYFNPLFSKCLVVIERLLARITNKIVAISPAQKNELSVKYSIARPEKITLVPLGIDELLFTGGEKDKRDCFRQKYKLAPGTVAIGIVGRIVPVKNYDLFVKVVAGVLANTQYTVKFFVVGDGAEKTKVQQNFSKLGVSWCDENNFTAGANVIFTSWVPEVVNVLYGLDVIVLTSHNEGTPMSLIEAQFCGKPVVATDVGGVKDTFIHGETGFLVPAGNEGLFVQQLSLLAGNGQLRETMGRNGAIFARENFSKKKEIQRFKALYQSCNT